MTSAGFSADGAHVISGSGDNKPEDEHTHAQNNSAAEKQEEEV